MRLLTAALIVFGLLQSVAAASTITATQQGDVDSHGDGRYLDVVVTALPGESNDVSVAGAKGSVTVSDGAGLSAGPGCVQLDADTARCAARVPGLAVSVFTGDGDDRVDLGSTPGQVDGGPGNDELTAAGDATLTGGAGDDRLTGGGLATGDGAGAVPGDDVIIGSARVSYSERTVPVTVDLTKHVGGQVGEHDTIDGPDGIIGGSAGDVLIGNDRDNYISSEEGAGDVMDGRAGDDFISGTDGDDTLRGGAGNDQLFGWKGTDDFDGGPGNDRLSIRTGRGPARTQLRCGSGVDEVGAGQAVAVVPSDCERVGDNSPFLRVERASSRRLIARAYTPRGTGFCDVHVSLTDSLHRVVGRAVIPYGDRSHAQTAALTAVGRRLLGRTRLRLTVRATEKCSNAPARKVVDYIAAL